MPKRSCEAIATYIRNLPHKPLETLISHCGCTCINNQARFVIWAPARSNHKLSVELILPNKHKELHALTPIQDDFFIAIINDIPLGTLYYYTDAADNSCVPDIYSLFQPQGINGPSAIIDTSNYFWSYEIKPRCPHSIIKIHLGTASPKGTFSDFIHTTLKEPLFQHADAIEFLPLGEFPGAFNWGYDGGPNFISSVAHTYGQPQELMDLIDTLHSRNILVGFDIQLNHYGPEGVHQDWYGPYLSQERLEWGYRPNFGQPIVRQLLLKKLSQFVRLYRPDYLRLDMSSRYGDDTLITEIRELTQLPIILEDERDQPNLVTMTGQKCIAQWHFPTVHALEKIRSGNYQDLATTVEAILYKSATHVVFANSHDEQGNNQALAPFDRFSYGLTALTNGMMLFFYSFGFFHFFCDYEDDIQTVMVTAEKSGCLKVLPSGLWQIMRPLHKHFKEYKQCQDFFEFMHKLWQDEIRTLPSADPKRAQHVGIWIKNNPELVSICRAYNQSIFKLCNASYSFSGKGFYNFICTLFKIRQGNPWLKNAYPHGTYTYSPDRQELSITRHSLETKTRITLAAQLPERVTISVTEQ